MNNASGLARALNLTSQSAVDGFFSGAVEHGGSFLGSLVQAGAGNPTVKGIPVDLIVAGGLLMTGSPVARSLGSGMTIGVAARYGDALGKKINIARQLASKT